MFITYFCHLCIFNTIRRTWSQQAASLLLGWLILEIWMILWLSSQRREEVSLSCVNIATILLIFSPKASITSHNNFYFPTPSNFCRAFFLPWWCFDMRGQLSLVLSSCQILLPQQWAIHFPSMIQIWPAFIGTQFYFDLSQFLREDI